MIGWRRPKTHPGTRQLIIFNSWARQIMGEVVRVGEFISSILYYIHPLLHFTSTRILTQHPLLVEYTVSSYSVLQGHVKRFKVTNQDIPWDTKLLLHHNSLPFSVRLVLCKQQNLGEQQAQLENMATTEFTDLPLRQEITGAELVGNENGSSAGISAGMIPPSSHAPIYH